MKNSSTSNQHLDWLCSVVFCAYLQFQNRIFLIQTRKKITKLRNYNFSLKILLLQRNTIYLQLYLSQWKRHAKSAMRPANQELELDYSV